MSFPELHPCLYPCPCFHPSQFGQLGLGDSIDRTSPCVVLLPEQAHVQQLACGWRHTLAVTQDGRVFSWGRGVNGQLGHGVEEDA